MRTSIANQNAAIDAAATAIAAIGVRAVVASLSPIAVSCVAPFADSGWVVYVRTGE